ncbi:Bud site selection protein 5 [Dictyocoela muelleri]|nr:Bud site selection protein 5 [Dictyocoela muelleri]
MDEKKIFQSFLNKFYKKQGINNFIDQKNVKTTEEVLKINYDKNNLFSKDNNTHYILKWDPSSFPISEYHDNDLKVLEKYSEFSIYNKLSKSAKVLTLIDISILKKINSFELTRYGKEDCVNINILINKNKKLKHFVAQEISKKEKRIDFFFRLAKKLKKMRNFNSMSCIIEGIRMSRLSNRNFKKISDLYESTSNYFVLRELVKICTESSEFIIPPMDIVLTDIAESNIISDSEVANMKFFKIISFFIRLQSQDFNFKSKLEFTWLCNLYNTQCFMKKRSKKLIDITDLYLLM